jgi:hypothetical protein
VEKVEKRRLEVGEIGVTWRDEVIRGGYPKKIASSSLS